MRHSSMTSIIISQTSERWYDRDTGLVHFGFRDYDPTVGRFTAPDPANDLRGGADLYDYCSGDPVSCLDPEGLAWIPVIAGIAEYVGKEIVKRVGKAIVNKSGNNNLNASEEMVDVRKRIMEAESRIASGKASDDDLKTIDQDRRRENELWNKYGEHYVGSEFYRPYFPHNDYAALKFNDAKWWRENKCIPRGHYMFFK